jgi:RNA polymerase sigma factor (sigma-70 family)
MKTKTMELELAQRKNITDIVAEYSSRLAGFIRKRVTRLEDAEDILQEVFSQLSEADRLMKPIDEMTGWLFTVTRNRITDFYRKKRPELFSGIYSDDEMDETESSLGNLIVDNSDTPETAFLRSLVWEELAAALNDLPPEQREVFELTEFEGLPFKDIAKLTGEPVNTLISRKHYAVLYLRERLRNIYDELINF